MRKVSRIISYVCWDLGGSFIGGSTVFPIALDPLRRVQTSQQGTEMASLVSFIHCIPSNYCSEFLGPVLGGSLNSFVSLPLSSLVMGEIVLAEVYE